ncbi:phosphoenolpyruvate synthase [Clostridium estertheticum]|uniref:phosphoenolpyruvate synthase n=1 Tax=Clostridium estertheticum TaxID=238834 RepID=UPI001CF57EB9|nr:phosphoenolpyruvate synthase [Clostridium estertheticum]MCB2353832.1 phosphoenolpyruvate synthase [Clostridium estertheticum]WAG40469.1 phosphoenolpyruvate synthase [Clostridium estertheticum]
METNYILFFDEIDKKDISLVGGKGANLGEMTKAGFHVPYGFCVTTQAYREFLQYNNLLNFITEMIKDANIDNITEIGEKIREKIGQSAIPEKVAKEILNAINKTGTNNYYAVRSSATAEDLAFASFAGQQDTYLNIKGENSVLLSVRDCWASLFTDRAILYRIQNKIEHEKVYMSAVVQKMIVPEVAGIMFTADPLSGHRGIISIDASYGLGEALVSGLVSPDIYKVRKSNMQIDNKIIGDKKLAILPIEGGGTKKVEITGKKSKSQVMIDSCIKKLAQLGMKIEKHYGCPQDIEWCLEKSELYIVQSRAITSLFPLPAPLPQDDALHAYFSFNHCQVMTDPISPLGIGILRIILPFDKGVRSESGYKFLTCAAGRIYIDLSELLKYKKIRKGLPSFFKNVDELLSESLIELINRPDFKTKIKKRKHTDVALLKYMSPILINGIKNITYKKPEDTIEFMNRYVETRVKKTVDAIDSAKQGIDKLEAIYKASSYDRDFQKLIPKMGPGMISFKVLERLEQKLLGTNHYVNTIAKGLEGNITTEMGLLIGDLADIIRKSPDLVIEFENENYSTLFYRIDKLKGNDEFKRLFNTFMDKYDMRAAGEIDMAKDRWIENPEPLAKSILAIIKTSQEGIHRKEYKDTIEKAKKAAEEFIREVEAKHGKVKGKIVRRFIRILRNVLPAREHPKYLIMKMILIFKKAFLEEAKVLVEKGYLAYEKDIFYINFWELYSAVQNNESLIDLARQRKEEYDHYRKLSPPRVLTSDGEEIKAGYKKENMPEGALIGIPVSSGVIEGIARVITDPSKDSINKGEILVAPFTDPGWTPLFINAAGLVMEIGGLLTHGTVVAREYGIPAVVGVSDATKKIKTGQKIRVDGNTGFVIII